MSRYILIDGGQGGCRIVYMADGKRVLTGNGAGLSRQARDRSAGVLRVIERAFADLGPRSPDAVDAIVAGLTGFDGASQTAGTVADGFRTLVRTGRVVVTNDAVTSYLGAIGFEPGVVVAAGTGVIALAGDREGNFARSDGWGYILGDDGGGSYIGRRGLASALRAHDGREGSQALLQRAKDQFGKPESLRDRVYSSPNPAGEVAMFARKVAEAAREGDSVAEEIWAIAARGCADVDSRVGPGLRPRRPCECFVDREPVGRQGSHAPALPAAHSCNMAEGPPPCTQRYGLEWRGTARLFEP